MTVPDWVGLTQFTLKGLQVSCGRLNYSVALLDVKNVKGRPLASSRIESKITNHR